MCASSKTAVVLDDEKKIDKKEILDALRAWQESGNLPEDVEIVSQVVNACNEVSKEKNENLTNFQFLNFFLLDSRTERETS